VDDLQARIERELIAAAGRPARLRYARSPLPRPGVLAVGLSVIVLLVCALFAGAALRDQSPPGPADDRARPAEPKVHTVRVVPLPTPAPITGPPLIVQAREVPDAEARFARDGGTDNGTLERAWTAPGMQGQDAHIFLFRRGRSRCLSVPDPLGVAPGDRGVTCSPPDIFERFGVSLTIGSNYAAVVPDVERPPVYRHADGTREPLEVRAGGLVALARTEVGSAVSLIAPDGKRRTDAFRADQRGTGHKENSRYECSNGEATIVAGPAKLDFDPCTRMAEQRAKPQPTVHPRP
jgi:hypothetical protein